MGVLGKAIREMGAERKMIQGDICWHTFTEPNKRRPVLILINNELIPKLTKITVAEITTTIRETASEVLLDEFDGMFGDCVANLTNIHTIPKEKIGGCITHLSDERMQEVFAAIRFAFDFE
jgi:mRNA interferase MazF